MVTKLPSGMRHVDVVEVVLAGPLDDQPLARQRAARRGHRDLPAPRQVLPGDRVLDLGDPLDRAAVDDGAAVLAGAGSDVDDPVALADRLLVVLDDDHRVAEVAQPGQGLDQPAVVALVQPDRRLVEHVQRADEPGADLAGQADPLGLTAGQRAGRAGQRQVVEADVEQEPEPGVDLLGHPLGDHPLALGQLERGEELGGLADRQVADLGDVPIVDRHRQRLRLEAGAAAHLARHLAHVALVLLARPVALGALVAALDPRDHALVGRRVLALAAVAVLVLHGEVAGGALEDDLLLLGRERAPRGVHVDAGGRRRRSRASA